MLLHKLTTYSSYSSDATLDLRTSDLVDFLSDLFILMHFYISVVCA